MTTRAGKAGRPVRLTRAEYGALLAAWTALEGNAEGEDDPRRDREVAACARAMAKVAATLTTPAIRRPARR